MSTQQIQKSVRDVLGIDDDDTPEWTQGHLKKLTMATSTLYNASLNKVMLKQGEETARCHLCAYLASERLAEKHVTNLQFYLDRVPLEPRKARKLLELFKQNIFQSSPVKNFSWTPSPKKKTRSPIKDGDRFTAKDPKELRKQLFGTPTKIPSQAASPLKITDPIDDRTPKTSPSKARRRLAFEEDTHEDQETPRTPTKSKDTIASADYSLDRTDTINDSTYDVDAEGSSDSEKPKSKRRKIDTIKSSEKGTKKNEGSKGPGTQKTRSDTCLLRKKYYKVTPAEVIDLCNHFEIPKDVAYNILDQYVNCASFLVCPWQLVCGLVINATFVVFTERRRKDPRVDHLIIDKMCGIMKAAHVEEVIECFTLVKEIIEGEKWFRDLQVKHNYYDGACYEEVISAKLGSMLQPNNILVNDEQLSNWKRKVEQELSLRDMD